MNYILPRKFSAKLRADYIGLLVQFMLNGHAMLIRPNKAETAVHGCHCLGDMAVRMRKVLAIPWVGVWVCHLLLLSLVHNASISEKTVVYQNCKSQQYYNFCTTKYLIIILFYSFPSKEQNSVLSTMKKTFPMLCTQSPCVHSYHFASGMCLSIIGPYYMNIHWMYCRKFWLH